MKKSTILTILKIIGVLFCVYLFLISIGLMGAAFKGFGKGFAEKLIQTTSNPFIGLFIGVMATSIMQSSSTTTCIVVGMVSSGVLTIVNAIPIIMGANIGTTVTNTLVSIAHIGRKEEFKRAVSGGTIHDFFNIFCVIVMFPLQLTTNFLGILASYMSNLFSHFGGMTFTSPLKVLTQPVIHIIFEILKYFIGTNLQLLYILMLTASLVLLFFSLAFIVKIMRMLVLEKAEIVLNKTLGKNGVVAILAATLFTAVIQSSSITTSLMIPLIASGILNIETVFPIVMGANIGTTVTAMLASFATANPAAITVAFVHFLFNMIGVCVIYPIKPLRSFLVICARKLGEAAARKKRYIFIYVLTLFFIVPGILIAISELMK
ncbi:MAG: Na/Pi symporter [Candidatus Omnitrophica bacterium]|nr:Na/Pi symporter [Candidatus Omnitrophota bacterium]MDD5080772.1 Na/Pi symporter [Candidatus Omnitrophota bacterium]